MTAVHRLTTFHIHCCELSIGLNIVMTEALLPSSARISNYLREGSIPTEEQVVDSCCKDVALSHVLLRNDHKLYNVELWDIY